MDEPGPGAAEVAAPRGVSLRLPGLAWVLLVYAALWCALSPFHLHPTVSVETDFPRYAELSDVPDAAVSWDAFEPVGYPRLLRWTTALTGDTFRSGVLLSFLGGAWVLAASWVLARRMLGPRGAVYATGLLAVNWLLLQNALLASTDALWAGAVLTSVAVLLRARDRGSRDLHGLAGVVLGLSWCLRYATMGVAPWLLAATLVSPRRERLGTRVSRAALLAFGTLVGALPQLWIAFRATGNPFASGQAANVWFGMFGDRDWPGRWGTWPDALTLTGLVRDHPAELVSNWLGNVGGAAVQALVAPLGLAPQGIWRKPETAIAGAALVAAAVVATRGTGVGSRARAALAEAWRSGAFRFAAFAAAGYVASVSLAFWFPRFFLPVLVLVVLGGAAFARRTLWPALAGSAALRTALAVALPVLLAAHSIDAWTTLLRIDQQPVEEVGTALAAAGIRKGDVVVTTVMSHYDDLLPFRFDALPLEVQDTEDLQLALAEADASFLLLVESVRPDGRPYHPDLDRLFDEPDLCPFLEPLWVRRRPPRVAVFRAR